MTAADGSGVITFHDEGLARRLKALACTAPLHDLDARKVRLDWCDDAGYQMAEIALQAHRPGGLRRARPVGLFDVSPGLSDRVHMPDRSRKKRSADLNRLAASIVADATADEPEQEPDPYEGKNPAAVELGRQGGLKGGAHGPRS